jgi:hypothetical protein
MLNVIWQNDTHQKKNIQQNDILRKWQVLKIIDSSVKCNSSECHSSDCRGATETLQGLIQLVN